MKFLLDTHILLWAAYTPEKISPTAMAALENPASKIFYSAASLIEIAIKNSLGREDFYVNLPHLQEALQNSGYSELPLKGNYALTLEKLPPIHRDPFDRLIIAQALNEKLTLVTADSIIKKYNIPLLYVRKNV